MKAEGKLSGVKRLAEHPVFTPYLVLVILFIISSIAAPTLFPTPKNIVNILRRSSIVGVASIGMTLVLLNRTTFGRHVYAIGSNAEAARLTGVRVNRNKILTYALAA